MSKRSSAFVLFALLAWPAVSSAGPIEFKLSPTLTVSPGAPALDMTLVPSVPPPTYTFDPEAGTAINVSLVDYDPTRLPQPDPIHVHEDGTTHWNNEGYFNVDVSVLDIASGESAQIHFGGRAHNYNTYSTSNGWGGTTYFWFQGYARVTLGGNEYTIWGANQYEPGSAAVNVWVGPDAPFSNTPEPGTLLLGAIALVPIGLGRLRRK